MTLPRERLAVTLCVTALVGFLLVLTLDLGPVARRVPIVVAAPTLALLAFQALADLRRRRYDVLEGLDLFGVERLRAETAPAPEPAERGDRVDTGREGRMVAWTLALPAGAVFLGLPLALALFTLVFLRRGTGWRWRSAAVFAGVLAGTLLVVLAIAQPHATRQGHLWRWLGW